ncbi:hypothetical protein CGZ94_06715 [Enemella evansiae]|uniref:Tripartite ATP-independent periplasmic transporters DctQ component domain-containing protein n=2 Tax=Enemella evansiae TaxID=2016499 RepID=A0A255GEP5_9ACTN|nr:hypothetical protein CGZ94_06715 [Enemella evansiae]
MAATCRRWCPAGSRSREPMSPDPATPREPSQQAAEAELDRTLAEAEEPAPTPTWWPLRILEGLGGLVVLALALGVTGAVLLRLFGRSTTGVVELGALSMLFLVLLGAPALAARDQHVRLELLDFFVGRRVLRVLDHFGSLVQLVVTGLLIAAVWQVLQTDLTRGTTIGGELRLDRWWVSGSALVGLIALALGICYRWVLSVRGERKG